MNDAMLAEHAADVGSGGVPAEVVAVSDKFVNLMRTFGRARARMMQAAAHDVEWSAHVLLKCLSNEGPMRASAISDYLQSDPSTVSRQVAALVKDGLLERRADPDDGRASLLVLTPKADVVLADHERIRLDFFAGMLGDWNEADLRTFATMLDRFTTDYEHANHEWLAGRIANRTVPAGGTN